jgi:ubiquinone/menaquinone biosynthesis C-methylase UbiE
MSSHRDQVIEQFTRQAAGYAGSTTIRDEAALGLLVRWSEVSASERVLDVACGPGVVACAFARVARAVTGVDVTPAMLTKAREQADKLGLQNVDWRLAEIPPLPWPDAAFDVVVSRYAFHHMADPLGVLREMARVCVPGGRVVVCDLALPPEKVDAFNEVDGLRDPSHVRALTAEQLRELYLQAGLGEPRTAGYRLDGDLDSLLERSFPAPGDEEEIRRRFHDSLVDDRLGLDTHIHGDRIDYSNPIALLSATL